MAVPAASEDQAVAANGFTAKGMLNTAPKGTFLRALLVWCNLKHSWHQVAQPHVHTLITAYHINQACLFPLQSMMSRSLFSAFESECFFN